ncbi:MAG: cytochrome c1, partial [Paracoccaceae bacterium]
MFKKLAIAATLALTPVATLAAGGGGGHIENIKFPFDGPFGKYDQNQLQRGLQIYTEVCAACHGLQYVPFRSLSESGGVGLPEDQMRAYAAQNFSVYDPELEEDRPAKPTDHFPANTNAGAPDLSMMAKARAGFHGPHGLGLNQLFKGMGGPEYIAALLNGYTGKEKEEAGTILYENTAFPGGWISMAPPLFDEQGGFADGHSNDLHHLSEDIAAFLMWSAEPKMMARKQAGFVGVLILSLL